MHCVHLIVNPRAGRGTAGRLAPAVLARLGERGVTCEARATRAPGEASLLVAAALRAGADCVAVLGDDGTVNEPVNGYVGVASATQALAFIPAGDILLQTDILGGRAIAMQVCAGGRGCLVIRVLLRIVHQPGIDLVGVKPLRSP